jgi:hypothetical protein
VLLIVYVIAELNRPQPLNWKITLSNEDKNPYGAYILFNSLKDVFPSSSIVSLREPAYNLLHDKDVQNAAYIVLSPTFGASVADVKELLQFAEQGNHVFISSMKTSKLIMDTLGLEEKQYITLLSGDSTSLNFVNPALRAPSNYGYKRFSVDEYFSKLEKDDSTTVLGITQKSDPDFVKVSIGTGAFYIHSAPLTFSNYSMLTRNNYEYVAKALSYIPASVNTVYWDEYYKLGRSGPTTPLRFFLSNEWLGWALRLTIAALIIYVLFEMKRRQRIIPVIEPLRNTTLDFVKTVSAVYLSQKDNRSIAHNKIQYWLHYIRQRYYLQTNELNEEFVSLLSKRSGVDENEIKKILTLIQDVQTNYSITDRMLLELNHRIDRFYTLSKT